MSDGPGQIRLPYCYCSKPAGWAKLLSSRKLRHVVQTGPSLINVATPREGFRPNPGRPLREVMRFLHYSPRTEAACWGRIDRFLRFHRRGGAWRHPREPVEPEVAAFLGIPDGFSFPGDPGWYDDNDGNFRLRLGVVPEGETWVAGGLLAAAMAGWNWRAHRRK